MDDARGSSGRKCNPAFFRQAPTITTLTFMAYFALMILALLIIFPFRRKLILRRGHQHSRWLYVLLMVAIIVQVKAIIIDIMTLVLNGCEAPWSTRRYFPGISAMLEMVTSTLVLAASLLPLSQLAHVYAHRPLGRKSFIWRMVMISLMTIATLAAIGVLISAFRRRNFIVSRFAGGLWGASTGYFMLVNSGLGIFGSLAVLMSCPVYPARPSWCRPAAYLLAINLLCHYASKIALTFAPLAVVTYVVPQFFLLLSLESVVLLASHTFWTDYTYDNECPPGYEDDCGACNQGAQLEPPAYHS